MNMLFHTYTENCQNTSVSIVKYNKNSFHEYTVKNMYEIENHVNDSDYVVWIDIKGKRDKNIINEVGKILGIHASVTSYLCNPSQLSHFEIYDLYQLLVMKVFSAIEDNKVHATPVSILVGNNTVITVQNGVQDSFNTVRASLRSGNSRSEGVDFLIYTFIEIINSTHYPVISLLGNKLEELENNVLLNSSINNSTGTEIHQLGRRFMFAYRELWNHKEALKDFVANSDIVMRTKNSHFLRRCYDHSLEILEMVQMYIDMSKNLMNVYLAIVNNKINEVMKVLTVLISVFAPITIISSMYGMNFNNMPGLHEWWGFPLAVAEMFVSSLVMLFLFKRMGFIKKIFKRKK